MFGKKVAEERELAVALSKDYSAQVGKVGGARVFRLKKGEKYRVNGCAATAAAAAAAAAAVAEIQMKLKKRRRSLDPTR